MLIDAHHHFWKVSRGDYGWISGAPQLLQRDYGPEDLRATLLRFGIEKTVLIQAAQTTAETDFLLDIAESHDFVAGVVGWLDFEAEDFAAQLTHYQRRPKFVGLRPMLQDLDDDGWIIRPKVLQALRLLAERDVPFDFLTFPRHLPYVQQVMRSVPNLRAVIDHLSKPPIAKGELQPWQDAMAALAEFPNLCCKISGMVTEARADWSIADLQPYVHHVARHFGASRLMFGSDWPVCRIAAEYGDVLSAALLSLPTDMRGEAAIFGANAARFYKLAI